MLFSYILVLGSYLFINCPTAALLALRIQGVREYRVIGNTGNSGIQGVREYRAWRNTGRSEIEGIREYRVVGNAGRS